MVGSKLLYSLCLKMIVQPFGFFDPKMIVRFIYPARNLRLEVKYFHAKLSLSKILSMPQLSGVFQGSCCFLLEELYLQLLDE